MRLEIPLARVGAVMGTKDFGTVRALYEKHGYTGKRVSE